MSMNIKILEMEKWIDVFPCGVLLTDSSGSIRMLNRRAKEILFLSDTPYNEKDITSLKDLIPYEFTTSNRFHIKKLKGKNLFFYYASFLKNRKNSSEYDMFLFDEVNLPQIIHKSNIPAYDEKTLDSFIESLYDGIMFIENDKITRVNSSFSRITGIKEEKVLGKKVHEIDGEDHICLKTIQEVISLVKKFGKSMTGMGELKNGNEIYVTGTPIKIKGEVKHITINIRDITELKILKEEVSRLMSLYYSTPEEARISQLTGGEIIAENKIMRGIIDMIVRLAQVDTLVLFEGESGTGKELLARLIHRLSARRKGPFIPVNCGAIPENLFESELFGYAKGAFTGALKEGKPGLFELANDGIIFLDEIGELPLHSQVKLLKIIEDLEVVRVGGRTPIKLNVRIIAATNKDLPKMVKEGRFREDLFYRLYVVPIKIPPLRERREDIFPLAWHFLKKFNSKFNQSKTFSREIIEVMESYSWPGNVRELQNVIERMVVTSDEDVLRPKDLPPSIYLEDVEENGLIQVKGVISLPKAKEILEKKLISNVFSIKGTTTRHAARLLGVDHSTIVRKLRKYGLKTRSLPSEQL